MHVREEEENKEIMDTKVSQPILTSKEMGEYWLETCPMIEMKADTL